MYSSATDYAKVLFDKGCRQELFELLGKLDIFGKYVRIVCCIKFQTCHWEIYKSVSSTCWLNRVGCNFLSWDATNLRGEKNEITNRGETIVISSLGMHGSSQINMWSVPTVYVL